MPVINCNGRFVPADLVAIRALDAGLQHAVGLFETMLGGIGVAPPTRCSSSHAAAWVHRLDEHIARLVRSAGELGLSDSLDPGALGRAVLETVRHAGLEHARVRLTVTGGNLNLLEPDRRGTPAAPNEPTILVVVQPAGRASEATFEAGVPVLWARTRANPFNPFEGHKTLNYWWRLRELRAAEAHGRAEALVLSTEDHLVGGCVSNVFIVRDGSLRTPAARGEEPADRDTPDSDAAGAEHGAAAISPVLPGITRARIIALARARGVQCRPGRLTIDDVLGADEVFLTNSVRGVVPVVRVGEVPVGSVQAGELTAALRRAWLGDLPGAPTARRELSP